MNKKLASRKLWITVWAMGLVTYIVVMNRTDFTSLATLLSTSLPVYMGVNAYQKTHVKGDNKIDDLQQ
jgi:hypothetical protein